MFLKLVTRIDYNDKESATEFYSQQEITQPSKYYANGSQEHQTRDTDRNIFARYDRVNKMDEVQLKCIIGNMEWLKV